jgi:hypothetical protein
MSLVKEFMLQVFVGGLLIASGVKHYGPLLREVNRAPSSQKGYELTIQSLAVDPLSRLGNLENVYLRVTLGKANVVEFGKNEGWKIAKGEMKPLEIHYDLSPSLLGDDTLEFHLELVKPGFVESVLVRCSQTAREISAYNRGYTCTVPGETAPLFSYRVSEKGAPNINVAGNGVGQ